MWLAECYPRAPQGEGMTDKSRDTIRAVFDRYDTDGDGQIDLDELADALEGLCPDKRVGHEELVRSLRALDVDGNGLVSFAEFASVMSEEESVEIEWD